MDKTRFTKKQNLTEMDNKLEQVENGKHDEKQGSLDSAPHFWVSSDPPFFSEKSQSSESLELEKYKIDKTDMTTFLLKVEDLQSKEWEGSYLCLLRDCPSENMTELYTDSEIDEHVRMHHSKYSPTEELTKYKLHILHDENRENLGEIGKLKMNSEPLKTLLRIVEGKPYYGCDIKEKPTQTRIVNLWICMKRKCATDAAIVLQSKKDMDNHFEREHEQKERRDFLDIDAIYGTRDKSTDGSEAISEIPEDENVGLFEWDEQDDEDFRKLSDSEENTIDMEKLKAFVKTAVSLQGVEQNQEIKSHLCLLRDCRSKPVETYTKGEIEEHVEKEHKIQHPNEQLIQYQIYVLHEETGETAGSNAVALKGLTHRLAEKRSQQFQLKGFSPRMLKENIWLCLRGVCALRSLSLFTTREDFVEHILQHHRNIIVWHRYFIDPSNLLHINAVQRIADAFQFDIALQNELEKHAKAIESERIHRMNKMEENQRQMNLLELEIVTLFVRNVIMLQKQGKWRSGTSCVCLLENCAFSPVGKLYAVDNIIPHVKSQHGVKEKEMIRYFLYICQEEEEGDWEQSPRMMKNLIEDWAKEKTPKASCQKVEVSPKKSQTEEFGICRVGTCALTSVRLFDTWSELEKHVEKEHILKDNYTKGKKMTYLNVITFHERIGTFESVAGSLSSMETFEEIESGDRICKIKYCKNQGANPIPQYSFQGLRSNIFLPLCTCGCETAQKSSEKINLRFPPNKCGSCDCARQVLQICKNHEGMLCKPPIQFQPGEQQAQAYELERARKSKEKQRSEGEEKKEGKSEAEQIIAEILKTLIEDDDVFKELGERS